MSYLLPEFLIKKHIENALQEDIGHGDLTANAIAKPGDKLTARINSRTEGIVAGVDVVKTVFKTLDPDIEIQTLVNDGDQIKKDQDLMIIKGCARAILSAERLALNFIQKLSGIATISRKYQDATAPYHAKVVDTRKTTPNFRIFEKYAVKVGVGTTHRFGLFDCVMIKDNHIQLAGSVTEAIKRVKQTIPHTVKIEVEIDYIDQLKEALEQKVDIIMLDNMTTGQIKEAVKIINGQAIIEVSGNIKYENINEVASTGIDYISTSAIITKAGTLDIGLDI